MISIAGKTAEFNQSDMMPIYPIYGEEHPEDEINGEVFIQKSIIV